MIETYISDLEAGWNEHPNQPFPFKDVAEVLKAWTDHDDEPSWVWLLWLKDGRYATAYGYTDYTGWTCRSRLTVQGPFRTFEAAVAFGLTQNERELLGLSYANEKIS